MNDLQIGVIGYGYWGPNLVRNFAEVEGCVLKTVCDLDISRLAGLMKRYPAIRTTQNYQDILSDPGIDAVAIATPVSTHYEIARRAIEAGKHVFIEKPMAASSEECLKLMELAEKHKRVILVDHTFIYTGAVRKIRQLAESGELGDIVYFDSVRINLGLFQHDVNVVWDLAPHDLSIMCYVLQKSPIAVRATGIALPPYKHESIAYLSFEFEGTLIGHVHANWFAPVKIRQTLIAGTKKMVVYDDNEPSEKVRIYDKGVDFIQRPEDIYRTLVQYRTGDMYCPRLDQTEALKVECAHFLDCIRGKSKPITDAAMGLEVVKIIEAANESIRQHGKPVALKQFTGVR